MPNSPVTHDEFFRAIDGVNNGIAGIHSRLDQLNGRTRKIEVSSAVQWMLWVLAGAVVAAALSSVFNQLSQVVNAAHP